MAIVAAMDAESTAPPVSVATNEANEGAASVEIKLSAKDCGVEDPGIEESDTTTVNETSQV